MHEGVNHEVFMCFQEVRILESPDLWQHVTKISGWSNEKDVQLPSSSTQGGFTFFRIQIDYDVTLCFKNSAYIFSHTCYFIMKVWITPLVLAALGPNVDAYNYNGYYNRELSKDKANLFGRRLDKYKHKQEAAGAPADGNLRQRRMEGEVPVPPNMTFDDEYAFPPDMATEDDDFGASEREEQQAFFQAEGLDYLKNGIDPDLFEWVDPSKLVPSAWTCGFLKPELGTTPGKVFPVIQVYVCMRLADEQPAKKGNIFTHCGGPSSLSDCGMWSFLGEEALRDYNVLTIDQVRTRVFIASSLTTQTQLFPLQNSNSVEWEDPGRLLAMKNVSWENI